MSLAPYPVSKYKEVHQKLPGHKKNQGTSLKETQLAKLGSFENKMSNILKESMSLFS